MTVHEPLQATLTERAHDRLRADIVYGRLAPGLRLRLDKLAPDYGVGVGTLREILNRLASEGLVHAEDQRGFRVAAVSAADLREVAQMRLLLETYALPLAFAAGDLEWEGRVVAAHHKLATLERLVAQGDRGRTEAWKRYDREFHRALIEACGSDMLLDLYVAVFDKYVRYLLVTDVFRGPVAVEEHRALLDCALARDADRAVAVLQRHVDDCVAHALGQGRLP